jgi:hypothetical protein
MFCNTWTHLVKWKMMRSKVLVRRHQYHQQQPYFPSETHGCSGQLWQLWRNLVALDRELHAFRRPGDGSHCILTSITLHLVYAPSERHMCYTLRRGCSYAVAVHTMPGDVYAFPRPIATFYLSAIAIYRMPHSPHIYLASHIAIQSSLWIPRLLLHLLRDYRILQVWNIQSKLHSL